MPSPVGSTNDSPSIIPVRLPPVDLVRRASWVEKAAKAVLYILAAAAVIGAIGAACYVMAYPIAAALVGVAIALAVIGVIKGLNAIAHKLPKALEKTVHLIHAVATEILAFVAVSALYLFQGLFKKKITQGAPDERPILLVHGYLHNRSAWAYTMHRLKNAGFKSIYTINLWPPFGSIERDFSKLVKEKAIEIAKETGRDDLILVGHSMGGDVSLEALTSLDPDSTTRITHVATIASPVKGTPVAKIGIGPAREMEKGSPFTQRLQEKVAAHRGTVILNIGSTMDEIVPGKYAFLDHLPDDQKLLLEDVGHVALLGDSRVHDWLIEKLKDQRIEA